MERQPGTPMTGNAMPSQTATGSTTQSGSESMVEQAKQTVANVANQATARAGEQVQSSVARGKERTARALGAMAQSLRSAGNDLRGQNEDAIGRFIDGAAERATQLANRLDNTDPNALLDDIENFARREPAIFLGGALAIGLVAARFIKASRRSSGGESMNAHPISRATAPVLVDRDVTDSLVHRDALPSAGPSGPSTI